MKMYFRLKDNTTWNALHNNILFEANVIFIHRDFTGNGKRSTRWYYVVEGNDTEHCKRIMKHLKIDHPNWSFAKGEIEI